MKKTHQLIALAIAATWGFNFVVIEWGLGELPPLVLTALRFAAAALPALFLPRPSAAWRYVIAYGLALGVAKFGAVFVAIDSGMPAGLASLVLQAQALLSVLLAAAVLKERPSRRQVTGIVIASLGITLLAVSSVRGAAVPLVGFSLMIFAAASWAVANVIIKASKETRPISMLAWSALVPPLPLLGIAALVDSPASVWDALTHISATAWAVVAFLAFISTLACFGLWNWLIGQYGVSKVVPFSLLVPIFGITSAWIFLGEPLTLAEGLTGLLVMAGLVLVVRPSRKEHPAVGHAQDSGPEPAHIPPREGIIDSGIAAHDYGLQGAAASPQTAARRRKRTVT